MAKLHIPKDLIFYISNSHSCSYLADRESVNIIADPKYAMDQACYSALSQLGFRRSGDLVYAPRCPNCSLCLPIRLPCWRFKPNRSQRRNLRDNGDITITLSEATVADEQVDLYQRYIRNRHRDGSMDGEESDDYASFFLSDWSPSLFVEFRLQQQLLAVCVVDELESGLSAVYTFYDPDFGARGLGTLAILKMVEICRDQGLPYLYLGYLITQSPKMAYKANFKPYEILLPQGWTEQCH
ncbi:MAG: arginyltransferase [Gammaproteobacteria bacterium]|nr:arginyltransferase [Gammaproteobacteria bacterium]